LSQRKCIGDNRQLQTLRSTSSQSFNKVSHLHHQGKPSNYYYSQKNLENLKNNPSGKVHNQEKLLTVIKKQRSDLEIQKRTIVRLEKDVERLKQEQRRVNE
jgi:hypothetical protein